MSQQRLAVHHCASCVGRCAAWHSTIGHLASKMPLKQTAPTCVGNVNCVPGLHRAVAVILDTTDAWESLDTDGTSMYPPPQD